MDTESLTFFIAYSFGYADTSGSRTFQRTFPFRKTTSSTSSKTSPKPSSTQPNSAKSEEDDSAFDNAKVGFSCRTEFFKI